MPVKFLPRPKNRCEKATHTVSPVLSSFADFPDPADYMPVSADYIVKEDAGWDL